jgi:UDP-N-acetylglucosamine 2-epimerase (non-hydrolysing)
MAPVIKELARFPDQVRLRLVSSGQHREMLRQVMDTFEIEPDIDLDIMQHGQTLAGILTRSLNGLSEVIAEGKPDLVIAQGDTSTTFAASLASHYNRTKFAHVEAGLRTHDLYNPFPEEANRRLTAQIADFHFAPTDLARRNLIAEGISEDRIWVTGNTGIDAVKIAANRIPDAATGSRMVLVTAHRRENWGEPMRDICRAILQLLDRFEDIEVVLPMHKNPDVRAILTDELGHHPRVSLTEPPEYAEFVALMKRATLILTDSGGVQEEAPGLGKPVLVLRKTTERPEGLGAGVARLVGTDPAAILSEASELLSSETAYHRMAQAVNPYGDGLASARIRTAIFQEYSIACDAEPVAQWQS